MNVRRSILAVVLLIVSSPLVLLGVALFYEHWLVDAQHERLARIADHLSRTEDRGDWALVAAQEGVWVRLFDADGAVVWDSHTEAQAEAWSFVARSFDALFPGEQRRLTIDTPALSSAPGAPATLEIDQGRALVVRAPHALDPHQRLVVDAILRRGIRQLVLAPSELARLLVMQALIAIVAAAVLGRALVRPLERLSQGARGFPVQAIADPRLLARRDELGELARSFNELVASLDARWKESVTLAGDLTHELKNPLATIAAASERLAEAKELTPDKRAEWTRLIQEAVTRLQRDSEALLEEVRTAARVRQARREPLDYRAWLDALLDTYRADPRWHDWRFELDVGPGVDQARIDAESWGAALKNLIDNALVQPTDKKVVRLEVRRGAEGLVTDVVDFGPGVSEGNHDKVFTRFFTQRPAGAPRGTGIGLSIVSAIAEAHGGEVRLQPPDLTRGACFRLTLP